MADDDLDVRVAWERHVGHDEHAREWFASIVERHRDPTRHYHGLHHVAWMVRHLADFERAGLVDDPGATVAAACFHDAIHDPAAAHGDNERASARLARTALGELGWPAGRVDHVAAMIEATIAHDVASADDRDTRALLAADLAVLASEAVRYDDYTRAVRREYAHVDDDGWRTGRATVLHSLLARDHLFAPELGLADWEARARANLTAELSTLER